MNYFEYIDLFRTAPNYSLKQLADLSDLLRDLAVGNDIVIVTAKQPKMFHLGKMKPLKFS